MRALIHLLLLLLLWPLPARACEVTESMTRASVYERVAKADLIILARADGTWPFRPDLITALGSPLVDFKPLEVLKGSASATVPVSGHLQDAWLTQFHVCPTPVYARGGTYLLFLRHEGDRFTASLSSRGDGRQPFDLDQIDTPLSVIRLFALIQQQGDLDQQWQALEAAVVSRLRPDAGEEQQLEARHILDHLRSLSPLHPAERLLALYEGAAGPLPRWGLRSWEFPWANWDRRPWSDLLANPDIVLDSESAVDEMPAERQQEVLSALSMPGHVAAEPFFRRLLGDNPDGMTAARTAVFLAWHGKRAEALDIVERHYPALRQDPLGTSDVIIDLAYAIRASAPDWRDDPALAKRWPELARRLSADVAYYNLLDR